MSSFTDNIFDLVPSSVETHAHGQLFFLNFHMVYEINNNEGHSFPTTDEGLW